MKYILKIKDKGFTLVELMVVVAIITILTAIVTTNFAQTKAKARDAKRISDLAQIQLTLEQYFDRCNEYPTDLSLSARCSANFTVGDFISTIPTNNGTSYEYYRSDDLTDYVLRTTLESYNNVLIDSAKSTSILNGGNPVSCSNVASAPYDYCVVPK